MHNHPLETIVLIPLGLLTFVITALIFSTSAESIQRISEIQQQQQQQIEQQLSR